MDSCRFDFPDWLPRNGFTGDDVPDELHLAGLLGKTLLERNGDLETKLKKLEEFTEETLYTNKTLSRQVDEYKESLQFANKSCEHLESRLEECEGEIKELKHVRNKQEAALEVKARKINDLQSLLETLESDNLQLQEDLKSSSPAGEGSPPTSPSQLGRSQSCVESSQFDASSKELKELVEDLTKRLSDSQYQKDRMKQSTETICAENKKLKELLTKTESEIIDLQSQVKFLEDLNNDRSEPVTPIPPQSPGRKALFTCVSNPGNTCPNCSTATLVDMSFEDSMVSPGIRNTSNDTLFTELQNELDKLQNKFDKVLKDCTCSASIPFKNLLLDTPPPHCGEVSNGRLQSLSTSALHEKKETSLKDLFEEVYASLKKTSMVADQLVNKKSTSSNSAS